MLIPLNKLPCKNKKEIEINEEDIIAMMDKKIQEKTHGKAMEDMNLDELDELEDEVKNIFIKLCTGYSFSEVLILASIDPKYDQN